MENLDIIFLHLGMVTLKTLYYIAITYERNNIKSNGAEQGGRSYDLFPVQYSELMHQVEKSACSVLTDGDKKREF